MEGHSCTIDSVCNIYYVRSAFDRSKILSCLVLASTIIPLVETFLNSVRSKQKSFYVKLTEQKHAAHHSSRSRKILLIRTTIVETMEMHSQELFGGLLRRIGKIDSLE